MDDLTWQPGFDEEDLNRRIESDKTFHLPECGLKFIDDHFGPRPGCVHTLLGSTGRGKSTLVQSLILEWGKKSKILLYLSEESPEQIELKFFQKEKDASYLTDRLHIIHEHDVLKIINSGNYRSLLTLLEDQIENTDSKILIIDNLTTSQFYEGKFNNVMGLLSGLRETAKKLAIPILFVCHTKRGISEATKGLMTPDDARGSASLGNTSDYFYILYRVRQTTDFGTSKEGTFIYVNKSRHHDNQDTVYRLDYDVHKKRYVKDAQVNFKVFRDFMKLRDRA